jgi:hypothetical protein
MTSYLRHRKNDEDACEYPGLRFREFSVNDRPYGAIPGSAYWRHPMIGLMAPPDDRPNGATSGSA